MPIILRLQKDWWKMELQHSKWMLKKTVESDPDPYDTSEPRLVIHRWLRWDAFTKEVEVGGTVCLQKH